MKNSILALIALCAAVKMAHGQKYRDLEALGIACPKRDKCEGYRNNLPYTERSCECDSECITYDDCCIDRPGRSRSSRNLMCLQYGENTYTGVYAVSKCSREWDGPKEVKEKCEGPGDMSDPVAAAPATSPSQSVTYKNLYCAECNNADMDSLKVFQLKMSCGDLDGMSDEQMMDRLTYDQRKKAWGVNRVDASGNSVFKECQIIFDMPTYLNRSVRFCRANIISKCARDWTRIQVKRSCEAYMAVVFDKVHAYRNPHCAICNHKDVQGLKCTTNLVDQGRFKPFDLTKLVNIHGEEMNEHKCPSKQVYDPYFKRCRRLSCAFAGHVIQNGKCVPGG